MKAIVFDEFGGPDVLHEAELPVPEPGPGQVRVKVAAVGLNLLDSKLRSAPSPFFPVTFPMVPGSEVAGTVDAVGPDVTGVSPGDEVFGFSDGGAYAEYALSSAFARRPDGLAAEQAVALPVGAETSDRVLDLLGVTAGETVLIHGGAGAVGTVGVQLAVARGATVVATASERNHDYLRELGAIPVTYGDGLVDRVRAVAPQGIDAVYDVAGQGALPASIELRGGTDRIVTIADFQGAGELGVEASSGGGPRKAGLLDDVAARAAAGDLKVAIDASYPLAEAAKAHAELETGHARGKVVLTV